MNLTLTAVLLGIVEGLTEFIPVSSTGHLILAAELFGYDAEQWKVFNVVIQLGAILAVIVQYWRTFWAVGQGLLAGLAGRDPEARYDGYASCPITTARNKMLLAETDYTKTPAPSIPLIDTTRERRDMWYLKRYGLPFLYWNLMLTGRV